MHNLFEVVRLLSIGKEPGLKQKQQVYVTNLAWKEEGEISLLALACSNDCILLRYCLSGKPPRIKQLSWPPERVIVCMCFDPTVTWLLILTSKPEIFIIPAFSLMEPKARVNQLWKLDDATLILMDKLKSDVTVIKWWHTLDDQQIAVIGSKNGEIVFIDLIEHQFVTSVKVDVAVCKLDLVQDDRQMTTYLLITAFDGRQWNLLLETQTQMVTPVSSYQTSGQVPSGRLDVPGPPVQSILLTSEENKKLFVPVHSLQFQRSVSLSPQYAKCRHLVTAHCDQSSTLQVYDSDLEHSPLFVYKLPVGVYNVVLTDHLIFCISRLGGKKLLVLSNQRAEISLADHQNCPEWIDILSQMDFNKEAIIQQFDLPSEESVLGFEKKNFPFYWHEKKTDCVTSCPTEESSRSSVTGAGGVQRIPVETHTVLDGCMFVTNHGVYECRPKQSPERLFLELAVSDVSPGCAESLGVSIGLDLTSLFQLATGYLLSVGAVARSVRLYQLSKYSPVKRVCNLARRGHIPEVLSVLRQVVGNPRVQLGAVETRQLADLALHGFLHQLQHDAANTAALAHFFRSFLLGNFCFDEKVALNLLAEYRLIELVMEFAKARGLVMEALDVLIAQSQFNIPPTQLAGLASTGFGAHLLKTENGCLLQCLPANDLIRVLAGQPRPAMDNMHLIACQLSQLRDNSLLALAHAFDPSTPSMKALLSRTRSSRNRTTSLSSVNSLTLSDADLSSMPTEVMISMLLEFFVHVVLLLNKQREVDGEGLSLTDMLSDLDMKLEKHRAGNDGVDETKRRLAVQPCLVGCRSCHAAVIRNGDLYTWGNSAHGRLGHGDLVADNSVCLPSRVETLHMLQIHVLAVACGRDHTVIITNQGVYGWGCARYGQVGVGTTHSYSRPMLIEALARETCVGVDCGHYHTLVLTAGSQVYSWGWGVHGQLGHGDPEDRLVPTLNKSLSDKSIVRIAAGYCHSLALTQQGELYVFGCGYFGQLGLGNNLKQSTPVKLHTIDERIIAMDGKYFTSIVVTASKKVFTWGCHPCALRYSAHRVRRSRQHGQPLTDPINSFLAPSHVDTIYIHGTIAQVICGSLHNILLTTEGEVYIWGHNMEGQLGTGTKQEEKQPKMLTKINDRHIVVIKSGGEFNVAIDTNNQILVWGKNDVGQLGIPISENTGAAESSRQRVHSHSRYRIDQCLEVLSPTILKEISAGEQGMQSPWQQGLTASSDSGDVELWLTEDSKDDHRLDMLPSLETIGNSKYCRKVISIVVKTLSHCCCATDILRLCIDHRDWLTAADINLLLENNAQALCCHLNALCARRNSMTATTLQHMTIQVVKHHIRLCLKKTQTEKEQTEEMKTMVLEILRHWDICKLPLGDLETVFTDNLQSVAYPLGLVLFRDQARSSNELPQEMPEKSTLLYIEQFSPSFCMKVLNSVLSHLNIDDRVSKDWSYLLSADLNNGHVSRVEVQSKDQLVPYDQVWRDIVQNLEKNTDSRRCITLSHNEMDHLEGSARQARQHNPGDQSVAVLFTCGHHFTQQTFKQEVLITLDNELTDGSTKLPITASLLKQYYSREGVLALACPKCVLQAEATLS